MEKENIYIEENSQNKRRRWIFYKKIVLNKQTIQDALDLAWDRIPFLSLAKNIKDYKQSSDKKTEIIRLISSISWSMWDVLVYGWTAVYSTKWIINKMLWTTLEFDIDLHDRAAYVWILKWFGWSAYAYYIKKDKNIHFRKSIREIYNFVKQKYNKK